MPSIPFTPDRPPPAAPRLCIQCAHYRPPPESQPPAAGKCARFGTLDVIDGRVQHAAVTVVRDTYCKPAGTYFEPVDQPTAT